MIKAIETEIAVRHSGKTTRLIERVFFRYARGQRSCIIVPNNRDIDHIKHLFVKMAGCKPDDNLVLFNSSGNFGRRFDHAEIAAHINSGVMVLFDDFDRQEFVVPIIDRCYYTTSIYNSEQSRSHQEVIDTLLRISFIKRKIGI